MNIILLALSVSTLVFFTLLMILAFSTRNKLRIDQRIESLTDEKSHVKPLMQKKTSTKTKLPISKVFEKELSNAAIKMRPEEFLFIWAGISFVPAFIMTIMGVHPISVIAAVLIGIISPLIVVERRKKTQLILFEKQLGDALLLIGNCLRSGLTFQQAMGSIAKEMNDPIAREFSRTIKEVQLGSSLDSALNNMQQRVKSTDLMLAVSAVQIQHQVGGNLMEILMTISKTIADRQKLKDDIRVMTATGRMSGIVVGLLPAALAGMLMLINPGYIQTFFNTTMGIAMLVVAGLMEFIGFIFIKKTITIKY